MSKNSLIAVTILIIGVFGSILIFGSAKGTGGTLPAENLEIRDGIQYITITAGGGYSPKVSSAKAGIPTKIIVKTSGSYDCSSALAIRSVGFQEILPPEGETEIDIGIPKAGEPLQGVCSMGMYSFKINFI